MINILLSSFGDCCMQHRPLSQTPYAVLKADKQCEGQNQHHPANITNRADKANTQVSVEGDLGAKFRVSLDEWLQPLPSCQELEVEMHYLLLVHDFASLCSFDLLFSFLFMLTPICLFLICCARYLCT